ncbi:MAG: hypothetical protein ACLPY1_07610 [Terracidiphilus sp.]
MNCFLAVSMLGGLAVAQLLAADAVSQVPGLQSAVSSPSILTNSSTLPPAPRGKSTVLGGEIRKVDPVRDELMLGGFGQRPAKILFDERTQVYLDGKKVSLSELRPANHASVETVLDGTEVYALSIHMLSRLPEGEYQGRVLDYNAETRELTVSAVLSRQPIRLLVPASTLIVSEGPDSLQPAAFEASNLVKGTLISIDFTSDKRGRGVASRIAILATPGSAFVFSGTLSSLDLHAGLLVLVDPRDNKSYQILFDSTQLPASRNLHEGDDVRVTAKYDGTHYVATSLAVD